MNEPKEVPIEEAVLRATRTLVAKLDDGHWPSMALEQIEREIISIARLAARGQEGAEEAE
jgi:hypothetical protein